MCNQRARVAERPYTASIAAGRHRNWLELKRIPRPAFLLRATENTEDTEVLFPVSSVQPLGSIGEEGGVVKWTWQERERQGDRERGRQGEGGIHENVAKLHKNVDLDVTIGRVFASI